MKIRPARKEEVGIVLQLIHDLAHYEKAPNEVEATEKELLATIFIDNPKVFCDVVDVDGEIAGMAIWFLNYSTWQVFRLHSKNNLISDLESNLKKNSINFNADIDKEYTKVLFKKKYLKSKIFLYHLNKGEIGFKVIVPYEVNSSLVVLVDKGWIRKDKINLILLFIIYERLHCQF